ncbi:four helix bundle protein [Bacteroidota bacterium]
MKNFKQLLIWQRGMEIVKAIYPISREMTKKDQYIFFSQINRSAISIPSNIAEGNSRRSTKELFRYLEISLGSTFELETQLLILIDLKICYIDKIDPIISLIREEQKMINGMMRKIQSQS